MLRRQHEPERQGRLALSIEGGGMRGVVSAGMLCALEHLGIGPGTFDLVIGSSAGAMNAAYYVSEQARFGISIYYENLSSPLFLSVRRAVGRRAILDLDYVESIMRNIKPLAVDSVLGAGTFRCVATSLTDGTAKVLGPAGSPAELLEHLRASASIPFVTGAPRRVDGHDLVDASLSEPVPWETPLRSGYDTILVLATLPLGTNPGHEYLGAALDWTWSRRYPAPAKALLRDRHTTRVQRVAFLRDRTLRPDAGPGPHLCAISPSPTDPRVSQFERDPDKLAQAAIGGFNAVMAALDRPVARNFHTAGWFEPAQG